MSNQNQDEYNGWTNRETWATALHLSNDEYLYNTCLELCDDRKKWSAGDAIEQWVTEEVETVLHPQHGEASAEWVRLLISDVGSFWRVNWTEVASSFIDEEEEDGLD